MRRQLGALMISSVVALGVSVISSTAKAEDDASRFTYVRLHCTPDNQSHFTDVTIELAKENFAPPAAPIAIGGDKPTSRAFIAIRGALGRYRPADPSQSPYPRSSVVHGAPGCILDHRNRWRDETVTCR